MIDSLIRIIVITSLFLIHVSCIDKDVYEGDKDNIIFEYDNYQYPYHHEAQNVVTEITFILDNAPEAEEIKAKIPHLKYNKSWLFMLTQDDCSYSAYSTTWAAINGKPLSKSYFYNSRQLAAGDLPPDAFELGSTLGSTDGTGNEVRFAFTTTLFPDTVDMDVIREAKKRSAADLGRFGQYRFLTWENLTEMLAYDTGIAFHDTNTKSVNDLDSLVKHFEIDQLITLDKLNGRGMKVLAEPNGNYYYLLAGKKYPSIRIMTAQNTKSGGPVVKRHFPYKVDSDMKKEILQRTFYDYTFDITARIENELKKNKEEREAIHVGIHGTGVTFAQFLLWLNNIYGKDGDDSVWFPSLEEYYEYNYYRVNSTIDHEINGDTLKVRISLPSEQYFYYPSVTVNLSGIKYDQVKEVISNDAVTGLSYAPYEGGVMLNIDCRRYLYEHAAHFVDKYLKSSTLSNRDDAIYFVEKLKESPEKDELRQKIPGYNKNN